jgi:glycosyltransferase involved in cell wall biosynthesis
MKVAYITSDFGLISETFISDLVEGLAKPQQVILLCNSLSHEAISAGYRVEKISFLSLTLPIERLQYRLDALLGEAGQIRNFRLRLKHAYRTLIPTLQQHQPNIAYIDYGTVSVFARAALKTLKIPFAVHFHGADITSALNDEIYRQELSLVFRDASTLIVASDHVRRLLILEGAPIEKIHVVRYGIDLEGIRQMSWDERKVCPPSVVFLGRFTPKKHPVALVEAFALVKQQVPEAQLSMIGDGSEMPRVQQRIERLGLQDAVMLYGALPRGEALLIVNRHWVFAQHSVTAPNGDQEGFGIALAEAAALGLPVVSTLHNGIPEQVVHGETGFLTREFDYEAMAEYITRLLLSPDLAEQVGQRGSERIQQLCRMSDRIQTIQAVLKMAAQVE